MEMRRRLDTMPFDRAFSSEKGCGEELCHATGYEVCVGDPKNPDDWRIEFEDSEGELRYGG